MTSTEAALELMLPADVTRLTGDACAPWSVGGAPPKIVLFPSSTQQVAEVLELAHRNRWSVCAAGNGTFLHSSLRGTPVEVVVSTRDLTGIVHYEPADLVCTAGAGTPLSTIRDHARQEGQFFALDPTAGPAATLGAVAASAPTGPLVPGFGRAKDLVLGATLVSGSGRVLELGGRVVKNVAGFDLLKLAVGSGGRLGVITQVSVRLHGVPPMDRLGLYRGDPGALVQTARTLATAPEMPASLELLCPVTCRTLGVDEASAPDPPTEWGLLLRVMGNALAVEAATRIFDGEAGPPSGTIEGEQVTGVMERLSRAGADSGLSIRMSLPPARLADLVIGVEEVRAALAGATATVHATEGLARIELSRERVTDVPDDRWSALAEAQRRMHTAGGALWLSAAPAPVLATIPVRSKRDAVGALQRRLLESFDPRSVFGGAHGID